MPHRKRSVLIVDADAFLAGIYARRFEACNWNVRVAETVADAEKAMKKKVPDALVIDVALGDEAFALLERIASQNDTNQMVRLVLTALGDRETIARATAAGASGYLLKGHFVPKEVCEKAERLVAERPLTM